MPRTLKFRVGLYLAVALTATLLVFIVLVVRHQREERLDMATDHVARLSEVITRSTRFAMLQNQAYYVHRIIQDVGTQKGIERIRMFNKDGVIIDSTHPPEIGQKVDRKAEACIGCHQGEKPLAQLKSGDRSRTFNLPDGRRMLASMEVIHNEPSCYNAGCHVHTPNETVLGVVDIVYSLDEIDRTMRTSAATMAGFSLGFVLIASLFVSFFVHRLVYVPLRDLEAGAKRLAKGNLEEPIPVRNDDEFGQLATSFNAMTVALRKSQVELQEWGHKLEQKVEERTQQLRLAEAEAAHGEKMASVGLLAAGVAHELNNPLTGILTFSHLIRKKLPDGSTDAEDMDLVIRETKRCATTIRRLLDFAREKSPEKKFSDLNQIVEETARLVERPAHLSDIRITLELDQELPPVWIDENLIKQVLMNMLVNAQHAIESVGSITVRTRRFPQLMSPEPGAKPVPMVEISIIDTGCGIPAKDLQRIFDPFFTTKEVGKGTGLGLSVSYGIVKAHGGAIHVDSKLGEGSTFRVYLPLVPPGTGAAAETSGLKNEAAHTHR